jgi:rRNA maturation endonuclease Nob1
MITQARRCIDCQADISARHKNAKRCERCGAEAQARASAHNRERQQPCHVNTSECVPG